MPICTWRTMFSRTTMASSISRPTQRLRAISVIILIVKPKACMNKKVPMMEIGSVSPVMTVERQELRNKKTISTVRKAPSISVRRTLSTATRMGREASSTGSSVTPAGASAAMSLSVRFRPSTTSMVFSSCAFCTVSSSVRWPLRSASVSVSCAPSLIWATWPSVMAVPPRRATMSCAKSSGRCTRASILTVRSCASDRTAPRGRSWFSVRRALATCSADTPSASMACGLR